ncbi:NUDIX domain-containing protein [Catenulispora acidiphila]|uniref:NUDIX domain-containing protein n=1 Tax=Catenulispora acidiphila TaxID=304895 RepID=UPI00019DFF3C|nr:NUDIX domain-containing protein [Catenulispora acidiphila]
MDAARRGLARTVSLIEPSDEIEADHRAAVLEWIGSGAPLYRTRPPDEPDRHLVSYFVPYDAASGALMMVAHRKAGLDLPPGGHCEPGESPWTTVARECVEELGVAAVPVPWAGTAVGSENP